MDEYKPNNDDPQLEGNPFNRSHFITLILENKRCRKRRSEISKY